MSITPRAQRPLSRANNEDYLASLAIFTARVENLAAGADITARAELAVPYPITIYDVQIIPLASSTGVDGSNTMVVTWTNITKSVDIATVTRTTDISANTPVALTITASAANCAADDVQGIVVTNGAAADPGLFNVQVTYGPRRMF